MRALIFAGLLFLTIAPFGAAKADDRFDCRPEDNSSLCTLYRTDQEARKPPILDLSVLDNPAAVESAREMVNRERLHSGNDFFRAATILIHSSQPRDYLLAHVVATEGMARAPDHYRVRLLAALSLDRYLLEIGQPQVFGTQTTALESGTVFRTPLDCRMIDSSLRTTFLGEYPEPCPKRRPAAAGPTRISSGRGDVPSGELIRHIRAVEQLSRPSADRVALRRAAESLDSYLLAVGQKQVFGTKTDTPAALARLDCALLNRSIRSAFSVVEICADRARSTTAFAR
ncbi:MAG TPA: hypothetical protein VFQ67_00585 [Allosphingosinicella sp.]|jgi:hypothetical protein|nr:hypothetical protein [Allosphingosinicella sp.]